MVPRVLLRLAALQLAQSVARALEMSMFARSPLRSLTAMVLAWLSGSWPVWRL
jgi:hypothetical protein